MGGEHKECVVSKNIWGRAAWIDLDGRRAKERQGNTELYTKMIQDTRLLSIEQSYRDLAMDECKSATPLTIHTSCQTHMPEGEDSPRKCFNHVGKNRHSMAKAEAGQTRQNEIVTGHD